ncbi:MAG: glycosyltransferase family 39 protein [Chloroflexota bacterium]|nr:glycosyltransferase family 39 protein [Chloroflexota bacterium]MDQ5866623.1 glycosyltransferase family 39 protein [Chloroflexota bacterium]
MQSLELDIPHTPAQTATQERDVVGQHAHPRVRGETLNAAALLSVVLLGFALRQYGLTGYGIWFDEAYHIQLVSLPTIGDMLRAVLANPPSDPLYVLLLRPWVSILGHSDASVRTLSVVLSTATIPAAYWLGRVAAGRAAGLLGALLLAVSPYALEFGQQASLYVLASLATTLGIAAGLKWRSTGSRRDAILYVGMATIAIYSHYVVAGILALFGLLALHTSAGPSHVTRRAWIVAHAAILVAWMPWLLPMLASWMTAPVPRTSLRDPVTMVDIVAALVQYSSGTAALLQRARVPEALGLASGGLLLLAGWYAGGATRWRSLRLIIVASGLIFLLPAAVSAMTGLWLFVSHFMVFLLPAAFVTFGAGLLHIGKSGWPAGNDVAAQWRRYVALGVGVAWLAAQLWGVALFYRHPPHGADGLRELASTLNRHAQPGDLVLVTPPALQASLVQYYGGDTRGLPADFDLYSIYQPYEPTSWYDRSVEAFGGHTAGLGRFWLVYRPELDDGGRLLGEIEGRYLEVEEHPYDFATLYLFESP